MRKKDKEALERYAKKISKKRASPNPLETESQKEERIAKAKKDIDFMVDYYFKEFATSKSADFQIEFAKKVYRKKNIRAIARWGRGLAKSVWCNLFIPFYLWINDETKYFVLVAANKTMARDLLSDLQAEFESNPRIIADFGEQKKIGSWELGDFVTTSGFRCKALGMGQKVRGLRYKASRPDLICADDLEDKALVKNPKRLNEIAEWIDRALLKTMRGKRRRFMLAGNKFAPLMVQTILEEKHPKWFIHRVDAYNPETYEPRWKEAYDSDYFKSEEEDGKLSCLSEYNNSPHIEGKIFTDEHRQWCKLPRLDHMKTITGHWDVAYSDKKTADFNAVRVWGLKDHDFFLIDCYVKQSKMKLAIIWMAEYQIRLPKSVTIIWRFEAQFWNDSILDLIDEVEQEYKEKVGSEFTLRIAKVRIAKINKEDRIVTMISYYQNGRIWYNEKLKGHNDSEIAFAQLKGIEPGYSSHDDAPDADEQAISHLEKYNVRKKKGAKPKTGVYKREITH